MGTPPIVITSFRLKREDHDRFRTLTERLQARYKAQGIKTTVTRTTTLLEALDALEKRLDDLDRKR